MNINFCAVYQSCACVFVCAYLPLLRSLQRLQEMDLFLWLHIDPDNLISAHHYVKFVVKTFKCWNVSSAEEKNFIYWLLI